MSGSFLIFTSNTDDMHGLNWRALVSIDKDLKTQTNFAIQQSRATNLKAFGRYLRKPYGLYELINVPPTIEEEEEDTTSIDEPIQLIDQPKREAVTEIQIVHPGLMATPKLKIKSAESCISFFNQLKMTAIGNMPVVKNATHAKTLPLKDFNFDGEEFVNMNSLPMPSKRMYEKTNPAGTPISRGLTNIGATPERRNTIRDLPSITSVKKRIAEYEKLISSRQM